MRLFKKKHKTSSVIHESLKTINLLIDFLLEQHPNFKKEGKLALHIKRFNKGSYKSKIDRLPWLYLHIEKDIADNTFIENWTNGNLRNDVKEKFHGLLDSPRFKIIFSDSSIQEIVLCKLLLRGVMERSLIVLGNYQDTFLSEVYLTLSDPLSELDKKINISLERKTLLNFSEEIFLKLKKSLGETSVLNIYYSVYKEYFGTYYLLDAFTATLNIVPDDILDKNFIELPSKSKMHKMLQQQVRHLEQINTKLSKEVVEKKKAEKSLSQNQQLMRAILQTAQVAILVVDDNLRIEDINSEAELLLGTDKSEMMNNNCQKFLDQSIFEIIEDKTSSFKKEFNENILKTKEKCSYLNHDTIRHVEISIQVIELNNQCLYSIFIRDITEDVKQNNLLIEARKLAEESAIAKTNFMSNISHELRTPINVILGLSGIEKANLINKEPQSLDNISTINFAADNLLALVNDILDFNNTNSRRITLKTDIINLDSFLKLLNSEFNNIALEKNLDFKLHSGKDLPSQVLGDQLRMAQILRNIVENAIKFTDSGQVELIVELIASSGLSIELEFRIKDTGIGIPKSELVHIFDSFYQVEKPKDKHYIGSGLGLAISKQLVELHGGSIQVDSIPCIGSEFKINLPLKIPLNNTGIHSDIKSEGKYKDLHIFVVEDNKMNQMYFKQLIKKIGAKSSFASNGKEALEIYKPGVFDLILMDLHMPVLDGYEATKSIRKIDEDIFISACSADVFEESQKKAISCGVNHYLTKPLKESDLLNLISSL